MPSTLAAEWMNDQPWDGGISSREMTMTNPACPEITGGAHNRTMLAKTFLEHAHEMRKLGQHRSWGRNSSWWTHLLVADERPAAFGFSRRDLDALEAEMDAEIAAGNIDPL